MSLYSELSALTSDDSAKDQYNGVSFKEQVLEKKIAEAKVALTDVFCNDGSVSDLVDCAYSILGNPIQVFDYTTKCLASCGNEIYQSVNHKAALHAIRTGYVAGCSSPSHFRKLVQKLIDFPDGACYKIDNHIYTYPYKMYLKGTFIGHVTMSIPDRPAEDYELEIEQFLTKMINLILKKNPDLFLDPVVSILHSYQEKKVTEEMFESLLSLHHIPSSSCFRAAVIQASSEKDISDVVCSLNIYSTHFEDAVISSMKYFVHNKLIYCLLSLPKEYDVQMFRDNILSAIPDPEFRIGVSKQFSRLKDYPVYSKQALLLCSLKNDPHSFQCFDDRFWETVFLSFEDPALLRSFCTEEAILLEQFDQKNGTCLLESLKTVLFRRNISQAATDLNIHRNTLLHRLDHIEDILKKKYDDISDPKAFVFSAMIIEFNKIRS